MSLDDMTSTELHALSRRNVAGDFGGDNVFIVCEEIAHSLKKARDKHAPMRGPHEGYAVILEELDELWDEIKAWQPMPSDFMAKAEEFSITSATPPEHIAYSENMRRMRKEAMHVAAMALAFLLEVTPNR